MLRLIYRLYLDLRRGWRIISPDLEQTGLLHIEYESLKDLSDDESEWAIHILAPEINAYSAAPNAKPSKSALWKNPK